MGMPDPSADAARKRNAAKRKALRQRQQKRRRLLFVVLVLLFVLTLGVTVIVVRATLPPSIESISVADYVNDDLTVTVSVALKSRQGSGTNVWCAVSASSSAAGIDINEWQLAEGGVAQFNVGNGQYYIYTMNSRGDTSSAKPYSIKVNELLGVVLDKSAAYMPLGGTDTFEVVFLQLGNADAAVSWQSSDPAVVTVDETGALEAVGLGEATITATAKNGLAASGTVVVTDLLQLPDFETYRSNIAYNSFTEQENDTADAALASRVDEAGRATRAGAVAAARFLVLEFRYTIPYFYENGRLNNHAEIPYADGEGRYYHEGLYLNESRFSNIIEIYAGPAVWGQTLYCYQTEDYEPNGLSCGGYVSWALLNAGYDPGDSGSGDYEDRYDDLCDLGEKRALTAALMESGEIKVGDLLFLEGHIAMIIGFDDENVYVAESWESSLHVDVYERYSGLVYNSLFTHVVLMDSYYGTDGELTDYWE